MLSTLSLQHPQEEETKSVVRHGRILQLRSLMLPLGYIEEGALPPRVVFAMDVSGKECVAFAIMGGAHMGRWQVP